MQRNLGGKEHAADFTVDRVRSRLAQVLSAVGLGMAHHEARELSHGGDAGPLQPVQGMYWNPVVRQQRDKMRSGIVQR